MFGVFEKGENVPVSSTGRRACPGEFLAPRRCGRRLQRPRLHLGHLRRGELLRRHYLHGKKRGTVSIGFFLVFFFLPQSFYLDWAKLTDAHR